MFRKRAGIWPFLAHATVLGIAALRERGAYFSVWTRRNLTLVDYFPGHNRRHGPALERAAVER